MLKHAGAAAAVLLLLAGPAAAQATGTVTATRVTAIEPTTVMKGYRASKIVGATLTNEANEKNVVGTADYLAPEQAMDSHEVDIRADIYSLGATFYFLLVGEHAITGDSFPELLKHACLEPFPDIRKARDWLPEELVAIIARATQKDPKDRYPDAGALAADLAEFRRWIEKPVDASRAGFGRDASEKIRVRYDSYAARISTNFGSSLK